MKYNLPLATVLSLGISGLAFAQAIENKVGIVHFENALISTVEGKKAVDELNVNFIEPNRKLLAGMQDEIAALQAELNKGSNTMGEERRRELMRQIDEKTRALNRATEDAELEVQTEQNKIYQTLGQRMLAIISKYSAENGFSLMLDVSNPQVPVLFAANGIEITQEVIKLYDEQYPGASAAAAAPAPATPQP